MKFHDSLLYAGQRGRRSLSGLGQADVYDVEYTPAPTSALDTTYASSTGMSTTAPSSIMMDLTNFFRSATPLVTQTITAIKGGPTAQPTTQVRYLPAVASDTSKMLMLAAAGVAALLLLRRR